MAEQATDFKRQTAYKCNIAALNNSAFVKREGWESNYVMTEYGDFSRVNLLGVVVDKDENSITIDDGTGQISGRMFERTELLQGTTIGDSVIIIGRPREYSGNKYLTIEIIKKIDRRWLGYRKKELSLIKKIRNNDQLRKIESPIQEPQIVQSEITINSKEKMMKIINELDKGDGVMLEDVLKLSNVSNGEELVSDMLMLGEAYEPKPGRIKLM